MRCTSTYNLEVHHKNRDGGNGLDNAEVLCQRCHANTRTYGIEGKTPPAFSEDTKERAFRRAGNRCECARSTCGFH